MQAPPAARPSPWLARLTDRRLTLVCALTTAASLASSTLLPRPELLLPAIRCLLALFALQLTACTVQHFRKLRAGVLLLHIATLTVMSASFVGGLLGWTATINLYAGADTDTAFRWDREEDTPLGFTLRLERIHRTFYPIEAKIGVLLGETKAGLHTVRTGEQFLSEGLRIVLTDLDPSTRVARLSLFRKDSEEHIGDCDTTGECNLPLPAPLRFRLVAFRNPVLRQLDTELRITGDDGRETRGISRVNDPLCWQNLRIFTTQVATDPEGQPYAGIQIVKEPGIPLVYGGFFLFALGGCMELARLFTARRARGTNPRLTMKSEHDTG